jgi:hypothetical protein
LTLKTKIVVPLQQMKFKFFITISFAFSLATFSQPKGEFDRKKEITYDGKRYSVFNNYITVGGGSCYNNFIQNTNLNIGADFNYHIQKIYFQSGLFLAGPYFGNYNHLQIHTAVGKRFELKKFNLAGYLGGSYAFINRPFVDTALNVTRSQTLNPLGLHAAVQFTYKYKYDLGIGICLFSDINKYQSVYGLRLELYFSGAFLGDKRRKDEDNSALPYQD